MHMNLRILLPCLFLVSLPAAAQVSGDPDLSFSGDGVAAIDFPSNHDDRGLCMLVQPDGRILVGGGSHQGNGTKFALTRLMPDGSLDVSFGSGGRVATQVGSPPNLDEAFQSLALQPDGKIIAVGRTFVNGSGYRAAILRYSVTGVLDPSFSGDGIQVDDHGTGDDDTYYGVGVQDDGRIVVAGVAKGSTEYDVLVARYTSAGALDATFSGDGRLLLDIGGVDNRASAMLLQPDGKIVVAGTQGNPSLDSDFLLARFTAAGEPDISFGTNGTVISVFGPSTDWAYSIAQQPDGRLVAGGMVINGAAANVAVARYTTAGVLDPSFDIDGFALNPFSAACYARGIAVLPDGRIVAGGNSGLSQLICMFNANGTLDMGFSGDGNATPMLGTGNAFGYAVAVQSDSKVLIAGQSIQGNAQNNFTVTRFHTGVNISVEEINRSAIALQVAPNPVGSALELRYALDRAERISINLHDANGRAVLPAVTDALQAAGEQRLSIALDAGLAPGAYSLVVSSERGVIGSARVVVE